MTPNRAFVEDVQLDAAGALLLVNGVTLVREGATLIGRHVALQQTHPIAGNELGTETRSIGGPASPGGKGWSASLRAEGFTTGPASAIGIEVYYVGGIEPTADDGSPGDDDRRVPYDVFTDGPSFETFTWSQLVEIGE